MTAAVVGAVPSSTMTRPVTRIDCGSRDWPVALVLVPPSVEDPGGSPGRVGTGPVVELAPLDVVVDVAGQSRDQ